MNFRDRRGLREEADRRLSGASYDPRKLILIYAGATAVLMLVVTVLNYVLQHQIEGTGGLSGLGMRSVLETAAQVLQMAVNLVVPFWSAGFAYTVLRLARGQEFGPKSLLEGFKHFGPVLRLLLYRTLLYFAICFACVYLSLQVFLLTPLAEPLMELLEPFATVTTAEAELLLDDAAWLAIEQAMIPWLAIFALMLIVLAAPTFYGLRLADFALMDDPQAGAMMAVRRSRAMMKGSKLSLFKLDMGFWWFYLLDGLTMVLCYSDLLLTLLGVELPFNADLAYFVTYVLYLAAQTALYVWAKGKVECTYALGYEEARQNLERQINQMVQQQQNPHQQ